MGKERREKPCCWWPCFDGRLDKLHLSFMRIKVLQASFSAMSALEGIIVLFLLIDTDLGCDYVGFYQTKVVPVQIATAITFQITSGILTDISQVFTFYLFTIYSKIPRNMPIGLHKQHVLYQRYSIPLCSSSQQPTVILSLDFS